MIITRRLKILDQTSMSVIGDGRQYEERYKRHFVKAVP